MQILEYSQPAKVPRVPWPCVCGLWVGSVVGYMGTCIIGLTFFIPDPETWMFLPLVLAIICVLRFVPTLLFGLALWLYLRLRVRSMRRYSVFLALLLGVASSSTFCILEEVIADDAGPIMTIVPFILFLVVPALLAIFLTAPQPRPSLLCPSCSYDLRSHHPGEKCPECGRVIEAGKQV